MFPWRHAAPAPGRRLSAPRTRDDLVTSNVAFVAHVASEFKDSTVAFEDLLSEGMLGLLEAAKRFDQRRGHSFLTYAVWWIRKAMLDLLHRAPMIPVPKYRSAQIRRVYEAESELSQKLRRPPTLHEVSAKLRSSPHQVRKVLTIRPQELSLDDRIGQEGSLTLCDAMPDHDADDPEERLLRLESRTAIRKALRALQPLERRVLAWRFGVHGYEPLTLQEIGDRIGLSRERVRQIESAAKRRLRKRLGFLW